MKICDHHLWTFATPEVLLPYCRSEGRNKRGKNLRSKEKERQMVYNTKKQLLTLIA